MTTLNMKEVRLPRSGKPLRLKIVELDKFAGNAQWAEGDTFLYGEASIYAAKLSAQGRVLRQFAPKGDTMVKILAVG